MEKRDIIDQNVQKCMTDVFYYSKWFGGGLWFGCALVGIAIGATITDLLFHPVSKIFTAIGGVICAVPLVFAGFALEKDVNALVRRTAYRYEEEIWRLQEHNRYLEDRIRSLEEKLY